MIKNYLQFINEDNGYGLDILKSSLITSKNNEYYINGVSFNPPSLTKDIPLNYVSLIRFLLYDFIMNKEDFKQFHDNILTINDSSSQLYFRMFNQIPRNRKVYYEIIKDILTNNDLGGKDIIYQTKNPIEKSSLEFLNLIFINRDKIFTVKKVQEMYKKVYGITMISIENENESETILKNIFSQRDIIKASSKEDISGIDFKAISRLNEDVKTIQVKIGNFESSITDNSFKIINTTFDIIKDSHKKCDFIFLSDKKSVWLLKTKFITSTINDGKDVIFIFTSKSQCLREYNWNELLHK